MTDFFNNSPYFFSTLGLDIVSCPREEIASRVLSENASRTFLLADGKNVKYRPYPWHIASEGGFGNSVWRRGSHVTLPVYLSVLKDVVVREWNFSIMSAETRTLLRQSLGAHRSIGDPMGEKEFRDFPDISPTPVHVNKIPVVICNDGRHNYWHWHVQTLASVMLITDLGLRGEVVFVTGQLNNWQADSLRAMGVTDDEILPLRGGIFSFEKILYPSYADPRSYTSLDPYVLEVFNITRRAAMVSHPELFAIQRSPWIYVSRKDARHRTIENEVELADELANLGFQEIVPSELPYANQIAAFSGADVIVGPHGAGLTNIGFMQPGTLAVEIMGVQYRHLVYYVLSRMKNVNYEALATGPLPGREFHAGWRADTTTAVQSILGHLERYGCLESVAR